MIIEDIIKSRDKFCDSFDNDCTGCPFASDEVTCGEWARVLSKLIEWHRNRESFAEHFIKLCPTVMKNDDGIPSIPVFLIYPQAKSWEEEYHD